MDIPSTILFGIVLLWLIGQLFNKYGDMKVESGLTAIVLVAILFYGHSTLLGNPGSFWHTILKLLLDFLLVLCIGSGITAMLRSKSVIMALFKFMWCGGLTAGLLKLMKVW